MCFQSEANLEMADEHVFRLTCDCRWAGELAGFLAVGHWVQSWEALALQQVAEAPRKGKEAA
jgi:hypothetical protein